MLRYHLIIYDWFNQRTIKQHKLNYVWLSVSNIIVLEIYCVDTRWYQLPPHRAMQLPTATVNLLKKPVVGLQQQQYSIAVWHSVRQLATRYSCPGHCVCTSVCVCRHKTLHTPLPSPHVTSLCQTVQSCIRTGQINRHRPVTHKPVTMIKRQSREPGPVTVND